MSFTISEIRAILIIVKFVKVKTVFEVGIFDGGTTLSISANLTERGIIYTVDLPVVGSEYKLKISKSMENRTSQDIIGTK